jgi:hypothetical protein
MPGVFEDRFCFLVSYIGGLINNTLRDFKKGRIERRIFFEKAVKVHLVEIF